MPVPNEKQIVTFRRYLEALRIGYLDWQKWEPCMVIDVYKSVRDRMPESHKRGVTIK